MDRFLSPRILVDGTPKQPLLLSNKSTSSSSSTTTTTTPKNTNNTPRNKRQHSIPSSSKRHSKTKSTTPPTTTIPPPSPWGNLVTRSRTIDIPPFASPTFQWPWGDFGRAPGAGDYDFDQIRTLEQWNNTTTSSTCHGDMLHRILILASPEAIPATISSSTSQQQQQHQQFLHALLHNTVLRNNVAKFYYIRGPRWTQADFLNKANIDTSELPVLAFKRGWDAVATLRSSSTHNSNNTAPIFLKTRTTTTDPAQETALHDIEAALDTYTMDELLIASTLSRARLVKKELVSAISRMPNALHVLMDSPATSPIALQPFLHMFLLRIHQFVLSASSLEPEEATWLLKKMCVHPPGMPVSLCGCNEPHWEAAMKSMDNTQAFACGVFKDNQSEAYQHVTSAVQAMCEYQCVNKPACWPLQVMRRMCVRTVLCGANLYEREGKYVEAVACLQEALKTLRPQEVYELNDDDDDDDDIAAVRVSDVSSDAFWRARLTFRYAMNLIHLDRKEKAIEVLEHALSYDGVLFDTIKSSPPWRRSRNRLGGIGASLILLANRLTRRPLRWKSLVIGGLPELFPLPENHITVARSTSSSLPTAVASTFVLPGDDNNDDVICVYDELGEDSLQVTATSPELQKNTRVEELALAHYLSNGDGWTHGGHFENGVACTLFGILFFHEQDRVGFDDSPLPRSMGFIGSHKCSTWIASRLDGISHGMAPQMLAAAYDVLHGRQIRGVNWTRNSKQELIHLCTLLGNSVLETICGLFCEDYDAWSGGLPDLMVWCTTRVAMIEIKGPGDSLSDRQRAWGEKLVLAGCDVRVCYVKYVE